MFEVCGEIDRFRERAMKRHVFILMYAQTNWIRSGGDVCVCVCLQL